MLIKTINKNNKLSEKEMIDILVEQNKKLMSLLENGTNNTNNFSSPVSVVGGFTNWCQVSAGCLHSLGISSEVYA